MIEFNSILFPTDFSPCASAAQKYALDMARQSGAKLHIVHVIPKKMFLDAAEVFHIHIPHIMEDMEVAAREQLDAVVPESLRGDIDFETTVLHGVPYTEIVNYATEKHIDLIVMATHGREGVEYLLLGGTTDKVIRQAPCPVFSVKHPDIAQIIP